MRSTRTTSPAAPEPGELHGRLVALGADALAGLLVERSREDERLHARLLTLTAGEKTASDVDFHRLAHAFDVAVDPGGFVPWNEAWGFAQALEEVIEVAEGQLGGGHEDAIVAFAEHALRKVEGAFEYVDDSGGELGELITKLEALHLAACRETRPDPVELAERLFQWELSSDWETFSDSVERYADALGPVGVARFRELAEVAWRDVPERTTEGWSDGGLRRFRLSRMLETLARSAGDVDAVVAVLARDRSSAYRYLLIAEELHTAGRTDNAIEWAERGLAAFSEDSDDRLVDFLCDRYGETGQRERGVTLAWESLEASRRLFAYQRVARLVQPSDWASERERALALLRDQPATPFGPRDRTEVVAALLWGDDLDAAWREAKDGGCRRDLWLALARRRERDHPADALEVYLAQLEPSIRHSDNHTYAGAVEWLEKAEELHGRLDRRDAFDELIIDLRKRHRAKRNLMKRLDERQWPIASS